MRKYRKKHTAKWKLIGIFLIFLTIFVVLDAQIRPIILKVTAAEGRSSTVQILNQAIEQWISNYSADYSNMIKLTHSEDGSISAVATDTLAINALQTEIAQTLNNNPELQKERIIEIPWGTLTGISILNGRGGAVHCKVISMNDTQLRVSSSFSEAGINQTLHQLTLNVSTRVLIILSGISQELEINNHFLLSETVILGKIPQSYTYITGDNRSNLERFNDYHN